MLRLDIGFINIKKKYQECGENSEHKLENLIRKNKYLPVLTIQRVCTEKNSGREHEKIYVSRRLLSFLKHWTWNQIPTFPSSHILFNSHGNVRVNVVLTCYILFLCWRRSCSIHVFSICLFTELVFKWAW